MLAKRKHHNDDVDGVENVPAGTSDRGGVDHFWVPKPDDPVVI